MLLSKLISGILHVLHVLKNHLPGREFELNLPKLGLESFRGVWLQIALCYDSWDFEIPPGSPTTIFPQTGLPVGFYLRKK